MSVQNLSCRECSNGCCSLITKPYFSKNKDLRHKYKKKKAGMFFYNTKDNTILLVQSRGQKWGPPKGTMEVYDKTIEDCAIREVLEETGLSISKRQLYDKQMYKIDRSIYFYMPVEKSLEYSLSFLDEHDASGITWIRTECLVDLYNNKQIELNYHCKKLLLKILKINVIKK